MEVVRSAQAGLEVGEDATQGGTSEPAYGLRGQLELAVATGEVALGLELAFEAAQLFEVVDGAPSEGSTHRVLVDVVEACAVVVLGELTLECLEVAELLEGRGPLAEAERLVSGHLRPLLPEGVRSGSAQGVRRAATSEPAGRGPTSPGP